MNIVIEYSQIVVAYPHLSIVVSLLVVDRKGVQRDVPDSEPSPLGTSTDNHPLVSNQGGIETAFLIDTAMDPFGTSERGTRTINHYGASGTGPWSGTAGAIDPGRQLTFTPSRGGTPGVHATPPFQGYVIVTRRFPHVLDSLLSLTAISNTTTTSELLQTGRALTAQRTWGKIEGN